jgi:tetratricopeptide (TPR) repeat protein
LTAGTKEALLPKPRPGADITKLGLSLEEGFVASRVDGSTTSKDLALMLGKAQADIEKILKRLADAGAITLDAAPHREAQPTPPRGVDPNEPDYGDFIFPPHLMQEPGDLSREDRKRIIYTIDKLDEWTHYELLKVKRRDDAKTVKRAYFERSKEWHPDRFRKPNLGSFKKMIDEIFRRVQDAHALLQDDEKRAAYDETIIHMIDEDELAEMMAHKNKQDREARRVEEAKDRRKKHNPLIRRMEQAKNLYEQALKLKEGGQVLEALRAVQTAETFDKREEYTKLVEELKVATGELRVGPHIRRGKAQENLTNWNEAIEAFTEAVRLAPENGELRVRLAFNLLMGGRDPHEVSTHAQKAVGLLPDDAEAHFVLGVCYEKGGSEKAAIRELARAIELRPGYADAKKRLKKLKWGF